MTTTAEPQAPQVSISPKASNSTSISDEKRQLELSSEWPIAHDLVGSSLPCGMKSEIEGLIMLGKIPLGIDGTFYRAMCSPFAPSNPGNVHFDEDDNISMFRFHAGRVDMKMRYVETKRYKLERQATDTLFGLSRNPSSHCLGVQTARDSTANTNLVYWAEKLQALKEAILRYGVDLDPLETLKYDPFRGQIRSKAFTAHPKVDPFAKRLVCFGYEAKRLATLDIVTYELDEAGQKTRKNWVQSPWCAFIHDCAITPKFLIILPWPFETNVAGTQAGKQRWAWNYDRPATFIVVPRYKGSATGYGWEDDEQRIYTWKSCMPIHTAGAWEDETTGKIYVESSRIRDAFPLFSSNDSRMPSPDTKADFVRWELDPCAPTGSSILDPLVVLDLPSEFPRIDERFMTKAYRWVFLNVCISEQTDGGKDVFHGLNGLAMHDNKTGETRYFRAGNDSVCQEPIFIPRSDNAPEGDGWILTLIERRTSNLCDIAIIDTQAFEKPVAIIHLPFHAKAQIHGSWVRASSLYMSKSLVRQVL